MEDSNFIVLSYCFQKIIKEGDKTNMSNFFGKTKRILTASLAALLVLTSFPEVAYAATAEPVAEDVIIEESEDVVEQLNAGTSDEEVTDLGEVVEEATDPVDPDLYNADVKVSITTTTDIKVLQADAVDYGLASTWATLTEMSGVTRDTDLVYDDISVDSSNGFSFIVAPNTDAGKKLAATIIDETKANTYYYDYSTL